MPFGIQLICLSVHFGQKNLVKVRQGFYRLQHDFTDPLGSQRTICGNTIPTAIMPGTIAHQVVLLAMTSENVPATTDPTMQQLAGKPGAFARDTPAGVGSLPSPGILRCPLIDLLDYAVVVTCCKERQVRNFPGSTVSLVVPYECDISRDCPAGIRDHCVGGHL